MFELSEEECMIRDTAREYARTTLPQRAVDFDRSEEFPRENFKELGELGFMGVLVPEKYGGSGLGTLPLALVIEEIAYTCPSTAIALGVHNTLMTGFIIEHGTDGQKKKYLPDLASGEKIGAYGLTEPDFGSDAARIKTSGVRKGDKYIVNGTKSWITSGGIAGVIIVFVRTVKDADKPSRGVSALIIEPGFKGFSAGRNEKKLGLHASNTVQLVFEDMEVPVENRLGEEGRGFHLAMKFLDAGRIGVGAMAVGIAQACLDASAKYSKERRQFGKAICHFQAIQVKLADMAVEIEAARLLVHQAARLKDAGRPHTQEAAMAKLFASEAANRAAAEAVQVHGGYGYTKDYPVERYFRDAKITEIFEGTSEILRIVIARHVLGR